VCEECGYPPAVVKIKGEDVAVEVAPNDVPPPHVERRRCRCDRKRTEEFAIKHTDRPSVCFGALKRRKEDGEAENW
jgi:hypothetical protein